MEHSGSVHLERVSLIILYNPKKSPALPPCADSNDSVEINAIIISACIPTLRPVYLILLDKPGAERYKPRMKSSFHLHSYERKRSIELQENPFARDGAAVSHNQVSGLTEGVRKTLDIDVSYDDRKYLAPHETRVVQANSIV